MIKKIMLTGGGTGGHILPATNLMKHFSDKKYKVSLVTDIRGSNFINSNPCGKLYILKAETPTNKNLIKKIFSYFLIIYSIIKSASIIKKEKPDLIIGFGGYVSFPICFVSRFFNLPLYIYENNMILGKANRYLSTFSKKILLAKEITKDFPEKYKDKTYVVGSILNKEIVNHSPIIKIDKKNFLSILVIGGSQGAEVFGKVVPEVICMIKNKGYVVEINQQCLTSQKKGLINFYNKNNIKNNIFEFDKDIFSIVTSSSIVIARCGASSTAELVHACTPFIAVPLPESIDNHQYLNAKYYEDKGCCRILEQRNFNTKNLLNLIIEITSNKSKLENIRQNMKKIYNKDVYNNIENIMRESK